MTIYTLHRIAYRIAHTLLLMQERLTEQYNRANEKLSLLRVENAMLKSEVNFASATNKNTLVLGQLRVFYLTSRAF